jgi:O-antigen ligase
MKDWRWFVVISVGVLFVAWYQPQWLLGYFPPTDDWVMSATYRLQLYAAAWDEVLKHPWIGRGLYTYPTVFEAYDTGYQVHTHNLVLEFLLSGGIVGVILFGQYVKSVLAQPLGQWLKKGHPRMALLWGMVALELANGVTDAVIVFPQSFVLFCLVLLMTDVETRAD